MARKYRLKDHGCTYFLCPDPSCSLFTKPDCLVPCESKCPYGAEKAVVCFNCGETIILPNDHSMFRRVDCSCGASNFQRMSSKYRRYNIRRKK
jgi:hypothetical protein